MKKIIFNFIFLLPSILLSACYGTVSLAHTLNGSLGEDAGAVDLYQIICTTDGEPTEVLEMSVINVTSSSPLLSVQTQIDDMAANTTDAVSGDSDFSPTVDVHGGNGAYVVTVDKTGVGSVDYSLVFHCLNGSVHTGTTIIPLQNDFTPPPDSAIPPDEGVPLPIDLDRITGSWFDPSHNGEGFLIEKLSSDLALVYWFTYDNNGNQAWIVGVGNITGQIISVPNAEIFEGGIFGPEFDPTSINREDWGTLSFTMNDCNSAVVDYTGPPEFGSGVLNLQRLTLLAGLGCGQEPGSEDQAIGLERISGSWFDPSHNGEGFLVEALTEDLVLIYWFTYDSNGNQAWIVGVGNIAGNTISVSNAEIFNGGIFGPGFDSASVARETWGTLLLSFDDCNSAVIDYTGPPEFGSGSLNLQRLTAIANFGCSSLP